MAKKTGKEVVQEAIQLAKAGKHKQALEMLEPYKEHAKVKQLYDKILLDAPEPTAWNKLPEKQRQSAIGCLVLISFCGSVDWSRSCTLGSLLILSFEKAEEAQDVHSKGSWER